MAKTTILPFGNSPLMWGPVAGFNDSPELPAFLGRDEWRVSERGGGICGSPVEESSERVCERALRTEGS